MCEDDIVETSCENDKTDIDEKSPIIDMAVFAFDIDSFAILLGYPRYAKHTERLHWHHWKVKNLSLLANAMKTLLERPILTTYH